MVSILLFLALWEGLVNLGILDHALFPTPLQIITNFLAVTSSSKVFYQIEIGMLVTLAAFAASVGTGLLLGLLFGSFSFLKKVSEPYLVLLQAIPKAIFLPAFFIGLGIGFRFEFSFAFFAAFVIMTLNTMYSVKSVPTSLITTARAMGASTAKIYLRVIVPAITPSLFAGARLTFGITYGTILIAQEFVGLTGIGYLVVTYSSVYAIVPLYVIVVVACLIGITGFLILLAIERYMTRWSRLTLQR